MDASNKPMHVGLSTDAITPQLSGIGRYTLELCRGMRESLDVTRLSYYGNREWIRSPEAELIATSLRKRILPRAVWRWNEGRKFRNLIFHGTNFFLPADADRAVVTVHDLSVFVHPETHPIERLQHFERSFSQTLQQAAHIITDSEVGRQELISHFGCDPSQVSAIALGVSSSVIAACPDAGRMRVREILRSDIAEYVLSVATFEPRKRIENAIRAHADMCSRTGRKIPLVLVGAPGWNNSALHDLIEAEQRRGLLVFAGFVTEADLATLYACARLFLYPSIYEGFGLPPIEAMANGVPAIVANRSCLPEVTKGAAYCIDPDDIDGFSRAIERCLDDDEWRSTAIKDGLKVARSYTWDRCVQNTIKVYRQVWDK